MFQISERILLTIWIGGMWVVGFIVAPTLFNMLDRSLAGNVAGQLFTIMSYIGLVSSVLLLAGSCFQAGKQTFLTWRTWLLLGMLILILLGEFVLQPQMAALKAQGLQGEIEAQFGRLHGIASILFVINSVAGLVLIMFGVREKGATTL